MSYFPADYNSNRRDIAKPRFIREPCVIKIPPGYHQVCRGEVGPGDQAYRRRLRDFIPQGPAREGVPVSLYCCVIRKDEDTT